MVMIPAQFDPVVEAMREIAEREAAIEQRRNYIGASSIGRDCARALWYEFNGFPRQPRKADLIWAAEDGHRSEDLIASRLRKVRGITLWTHDDNGEQYGFSLLNDKYQGHADGVILGLPQSPKTPHVWENKAKNDKDFATFAKIKAERGEKETLERWNEQYYVQAQVMMHHFNLTRHYLTVCTPGGRHINSCRTEYKAEVALKALDRAMKLIEAKAEPPRISDKPDFFKCKWCEFKDVCHKND